MKIEKIKADLHTHGFCGWHKGPGQFLMRLFGDSPERSLQAVCERGFEEKQNTLIGMVNFNGYRYEGLVRTRKDLPKGWEVYDDHRKVFVGIRDPGRGLWCFMLRGQEVPTDKGHVLILGGDNNIAHRKFEEVIKAADDMGALKIADHPLAKLGLLGKAYDLATGNHGRRLSLGEETLREYADCFDAIEVGNSNFPGLVRKTDRLAGELCLDSVYTSDSHSYGCMFSSWMKFPSLDFRYPDFLRMDLRFKLAVEDYEAYAGRNRRFETLLHGGAVAYNLFREAIGLVSKDPVKID